jgi:hypothetical protein
MKKTVLLTAVLVALSSGLALAQTPGVNLSWTDCLATSGGGLTMTSTCLSNFETQKSLQGSFFAPVGINALNGNDIIMDISTLTDPLPCWWNFTVAPRAAGYDMAFNLPPASCADYWGGILGGPSGGTSARLISGLTNRIRIVGLVAIDATQATPVPDGVEFYSFTFRLKFAATVGACTGCLSPACFKLNLIRLTQTGLPFVELTTAASPGRDFVTWQGGAIGGAGCPAAVPTVNKTWGSVKALYR